MAEMNPIGYGTCASRGIGPIGLSRKRSTESSAPRLVASGWRSLFKTILPNGSFLLASHGDLRIEWEEKDHEEMIKLIRAKMKTGVRFCILDPASLELVPIKRASRAMGREMYVSDPDIKNLIEAGFSRVATTRFAGVGQIKTLDFAKSAEEAVRAHTIGVPPLVGAEADALFTVAAIADFLDCELEIRPTLNTRFTKRTVYNWVNRRKLPVQRLPGSTTLFASKAVLRQWFDDIAHGIDPTAR